MRLRTRILLGYGYLFLLLLLGAAGAALAFHHLGAEIGRVLEENFRSVRASMRMLEALERQDSAVLAALLGKDVGSELRTSEQAFRDALADARDNITLAEEESILSETEALFARYRQSRDQLLAAPLDRPLAAYEQQAFPAFEEVKAAVVRLLDVNHQAMVDADRSAQRAAGRRALVLALLVTLALLSLGFLSRALGRDLLDRLGELRAAALAIAAGDTHRRAETGRRDELGVVARALNEVSDRLQQTAATLEGRLAHQRQALLGILAQGPPAALLGPSLDVLAATLPERHLRTVADGVARAAAEPEPLSEIDLTTIDVADRRVVLRPLHTTDGRHTGWLATVEERET
jgi:HAMP domain-containing protein